MSYLSLCFRPGLGFSLNFKGLARASLGVLLPFAHASLLDSALAKSGAVDLTSGHRWCFRCVFVGSHAQRADRVAVYGPPAPERRWRSACLLARRHPRHAGVLLVSEESVLSFVVSSLCLQRAIFFFT